MIASSTTPSGTTSKPGTRLQLGKVGQRELAAVDRRLVALIEERRDGHAAELRKRIMDDRLMADVRQDHGAAGGADQQPCQQAWQRRDAGRTTSHKTSAG